MKDFIDILQQWSAEMQDDNDAGLAKMQQDEQQQQEKSNERTQ